MCASHNRDLRNGFTVIEVLISITVLSLLFALTIAGVQRVRSAAAKTVCAANLQQLSLAAHNYSSQHGHLPPGCGVHGQLFAKIHSMGAGLSWQTHLLPYLEQDALWRHANEAYTQDTSGEAAAHATLRVITVKAFLCPTEARTEGKQNPQFLFALASYRGVAGTGFRREDGVFHRGFAVRLGDITDGTAQTLMVGERPPGPNGISGCWYAGWGDTTAEFSQILPATRTPILLSEATGCATSPPVFRHGSIDNLCDLNHFWSPHAGGGANFAFADGSVKFLRYSADEILPALATRAGGEVVTVPE